MLRSFPLRSPQSVLPLLIAKQYRMLHLKLSHAIFKEGSGHSDRPPLFVLHGLFGSKQNWQSLAKAMARNGNMTIITADARNHGDSPHNDVMTYHSMADDLFRLITDLGYKQADVLGHSMGGKTAMVMGLGQRGLVRKLIIEDVAPCRSPVDFDFRRYLAAMKATRVDDGLSLAEARASIDKQLQHAVSSLPVRAFLLQNFVQRSDGSFGWRLNLAGIGANLDGLFDFPGSSTSYGGETLFIGGSASSYLRDINGLHSQVRLLFPSAKFHEISGAGHWVHSERPHEFQQAVLNFLST